MRTAALTAVVLAAIAAPLFLIPIPFFIFGPGDAVDLNRVIAVPKHTPPAGTLYLTDVRLFPGRPAYYLAARALPGFEIVPRSFVAAPNESDRSVNRRLVDAMRESQLTAQVVAERAAGYPVRARYAFVVIRTAARSPGARCFDVGDAIVKIDGRPPEHPDDIVRVTRSQPPGTLFHLVVERGRAARDVALTCRTARLGGRARFGIVVETRTDSVDVPIRVSFDVPRINGSSAGLMFALQIYRTLTGTVFAGGAKIAGTGVLNFDGTVGAIEGAREKLQAAEREGASVFVLPAANSRDVRRVAGVKIVPVTSFAAALKALEVL